MNAALTDTGGALRLEAAGMRTDDARAGPGDELDDRRDAGFLVAHPGATPVPAGSPRVASPLGEVLITKPVGAPASARYLVAQIRGAVLRLYRTNHHERAQSVAREWQSANYTWTPGTTRRLNFGRIIERTGP